MTATRRRKRQDPAAPARQRRIRCTRCRALKLPGELSQPGRGERLCEDCLLDVANEAVDATQLPLADAPEGSHDDTVGTQDEPPVPDLALDADDEEERLMARAAMHEARSNEIRARLGVLPDVQVPGWPGRYGRVSASSLNTFSRCPEQWRRRYVLGERETIGASMLTGSALHGVIEELWHHKMREGVDLPEQGFIDRYHARFDYEVQDAGGPTDVEWGADKTGELRSDDWRGRGEAVAKVYLKRIAPNTWPLSAERLFTAWVPEVPIPVVGFIDFSTASEKTDLKFGRNAKSKIGPEWIVQAHLYLLADDLPMTYQSLAWPGARGEVAYRTPGTSPDLHMQKTIERYLIAHQIVQQRVKQILLLTASLGIDQPWPDGMTHTWACTTCSYRDRCPHWHPTVVTL